MKSSSFPIVTITPENKKWNKHKWNRFDPTQQLGPWNHQRSEPFPLSCSWIAFLDSATNAGIKSINSGIESKQVVRQKSNCISGYCSLTSEGRMQPAKFLNSHNDTFVDTQKVYSRYTRCGEWRTSLLFLEMSIGINRCERMIQVGVRCNREVGVRCNRLAAAHLEFWSYRLDLSQMSDNKVKLSLKSTKRILV